jgi:adenylosuccinate synthase
VGWFDAVATRYGCMVQGATDCVMTNLDVLGYLDEIKVCVAYEIDGKEVRDFPVTTLLTRPARLLHLRLEAGYPGPDQIRRLPENPPVRGSIEKEIECPSPSFPTPQGGKIITE